MQLIDAPSDIVADAAGFTLVEEDDVAFSLGLCREVHRLYNEYQQAALPPAEAVRAGLMVTVEMLAVLSRSVTDGMPAMRIMVAAAQTREMLAVVFDYDPMDSPPDLEFREVYRSVVAESARTGPRAIAAPTTGAGRGSEALPDAATAEEGADAESVERGGEAARSGWFRRFGWRRKHP